MGGDTYLVVLEEIGQKDQAGAEGQIKMLIDGRSLTISPKGKTTYDITSYHHFILLTNHAEPIKTHDKDRRNFIVRCSDKYIGNVEHFGTLHRLMEDKDVIFALYNHYRTYKPEEVAVLHTLPSDELPITDYQKELRELSFCPIREFVRWMAGETDYLMDTSTMYLSRVLQLFIEYRDKHGIRYEANAVQFGIRLSRLNIDGIERIRGNQGMKIKFDAPRVKAFFGAE
jgi:hypothetical protein